MTIDKAKLRAAAEAAGPKDYFAPRPYEEDRHYDDQELKRLEFMAEADPAVILALLAEIEQLREAHEQVCANYNRVSFASEERGKQIDQLKFENEALRKGLNGDYDLDAWLEFVKEEPQLRKDADRYRHISDRNLSCKQLDDMFDLYGHPIDSKIDYAISLRVKP